MTCTIEFINESVRDEILGWPAGIRAKGPEGIGRALFCKQIGRRVVVLHGFIKKTEQTPAKALEIARRRMKEVRP